MRSRLSLIALAIPIVSALGGCSPVYFDWDKGTIRRTPNPSEAGTAPASQRLRYNAASHQQSASIHPRKRKQPPTTSDVEGETTEEPGTTETAAPPPATTSTISMASAGDSSGNAQKAIEATSQRLARFDRNRLKGPNLATYDQASGFLNQSKQALAEKDYVAASGFARKASVLADKLQATVTAR